jgi:MFS family permease
LLLLFLRRPGAALPALFLLLGLIYASWTARIPALRDALALGPAQLGLVLLGGGVGAVVSFPLAAWLVARYGARGAAWRAGLALLALLPCIALASSMTLLIAMMFALGAASSCFDVAINALGAEAEKAARRSIMSRLHAWFCVGTLSGALLAAALAAMKFTPLAHFCMVTLALLLPLWLACRPPPHERRAARRGSQTRPAPTALTEAGYLSLPHGPLVALGILGFCGAISEGAIAEWSGVFMKDHLGVGDGAAPLAFAAFTGTMLLARLLADRLKDRFSARRVVAYGSLLAACGIFLALLSPWLALTLFGFALAGAGVAAVFPFVFSAAGRHGALALAGVATMSYSGGLIGPPWIGFLAHSFGLQAALAFVGVLSLVVAFAANRTRLLE